MKSKSFMAIVLGSIIAFSALIFSLYFLLKKDKPIFYNDGYVSITSTQAPSKAFFTKGTTYKNGYNNDIIFKDEDNKKINASKYSFAYYTDKSINYLNDGVLMSLDNMDDEFIPYYNIKSNYLIARNQDSYVINAKDKDININNFIGRISDSKYIVAGNNLRLKLSSSEDYIENYYFEIEFLDGNLVRINNDKISLETISSECYILVNDNLKIDLSKKFINYKNEDKINLEEITINSNQNIDIKYDDEDKKEEDTTNNTVNNNTTENKTNIRVVDRYEVETVVEYKSAPYVELLTSNINSHKVDINFTVVDDNSLITGTVKARLINASSGEEIDLKEYTNYTKINNYIFDGLASNSKYIFTIYASYRNNGAVYNDYVMFQRVLNTSAIGASLNIDYVSNNELSVNVNLDKGATFTKATINLYDASGSKVDSVDFENNGEDFNHVFENLNYNTGYVAKIENVTYGAISYPDGAASIVSTKTLKYNPFKNASIIASPVAIINKKDYSVTYDLGEINDPNKSIKEVIYHVYDKETDEIVKTIKKDNVNSFEEKFDLNKNKTYYFNAVITLNDNEKNIEYVTENSNDYSMGSKISPTLNFKEIEVTANTMTGLFTIYDPDNTINTNERIYVEYVNTLGESNTLNLAYKPCENESETTKCADIHIDTLLSSDTYTVKLYAYVDLEDENKDAGFDIIGAAKISTQKANIVYTNITSEVLTDEEAFNDVFSLNVGLYLDAETPEFIKENLSSFEIELYEGNEFDKTYLGRMLVNSDIVHDYFENNKNIKLADFGYSLQDLREKHNGGLLSKNYIIYLKNGVSGSDYIEFRPMSFSFEINDALIGMMADDATLNVIKITNINNIEEGYKEDTDVGIILSPSLGESLTSNYIKKYITKINYKIVDLTDTSLEPLSIVKELNLNESDNLPEETLYIKDYSYLKRGHQYNISYTLSLKFTDNGSEIIYPFSEEDINVASPVYAEENPISLYKELPYVYMFNWTSDNSSITSKYMLFDLDNAVVNDLLYYSLTDAEEKIAGESVECGRGITGGSGFKESKYKCVKYNIANGEYNTYLNVKRIDNKPSEYVLVKTNTFDGITPLNVNYEILKDGDAPKYNNMLSLKILGDETDINRIASFDVTLSYGTESFKIENINNDHSERRNLYGNAYIGLNKITYTNGSNTQSVNNQQNYAFINNCSSDSDDMCIFIDYSYLYYSSQLGSLFSNFKNKNISVSVNAKYDTGKVGFLGSQSKEYSMMSGEDYLLEFVSGNLSKDSKALGAYYPYMGVQDDLGYFVDDDETKNTNSYNSNYLSGKINLINNSNTSVKSNFIYSINENGVTIDYKNQKNVKIDAKELGNHNTSLTETFRYTKVVPTINMTINPTINGAVISGINLSAVDNLSSDNLLYFEINSNYLYKVNMNDLSSASCTIENEECTLISNEPDYKVKVKNVKVNNVNVDDYTYDYLNSKLIFNTSDYNGSVAFVTYDIVLYGLNIDDDYTLKAYVNNNGNKTYLVNSQSTNYEIYNYSFRTKSFNDYLINSAVFDLEIQYSYSAPRILNLLYDLTDLIGLKGVTYDIDSLSSSSMCNYLNGNVLSNSACSNSIESSYDSFAKFNLPNDFVYNQNYNVVINAVVDTLNGEEIGVIYDNSLNVRALQSPFLKVITSSHYDADGGRGYYIGYKIEFNDPDHVITNGKFNDYLARLNANGNYEAVTEILESSALTTKYITYDHLEPAKEYYFVAEYDTYINNLGNDNISSHHFDRFLSYTLNNYGFNVGKDQYIAENYLDGANIRGKSTLRFGYAANIAKDAVIDDPANEIEQEAYVMGILYTIIPVSGSESFKIEGVKFFDENASSNANDCNEDTICYKETQSDVGDNYYQIILRHEPYLYNNDGTIQNAGYTITYKFYLGGKIAETLDTEEKCNTNISNTWRDGKCFVLGNQTYTRTGVATNTNSNEVAS